MIIQPEQFMTRSLRESPRSEDICGILASVIRFADAGFAIRLHVSMDGNRLIVDSYTLDLEDFTRLFVIGIGKAAVPMINSLLTILGERVTAGLVITKAGYLDHPSNPSSKIKVFEASHPIPGQNNLYATSELQLFLKTLTPKDLVVVALSGGGSALLVDPSPGISLPDIQSVTSLLLCSGASISEINTIRKHIDRLKGGGLAKILFPATVVTLILSDVVGDQLESIASGPTVADTTTFTDAWSILLKYQLLDRVPPPVKTHLFAGIDGSIPETLKPGDPALGRVMNFLVGTNTEAANHAAEAARAAGFSPQIITTTLQGNASQQGRRLVEKCLSKGHHDCLPDRPACFIAGGETTVEVIGTGLGGRNQEFVLGAVKSLSGIDPLLLVSLATDGGDGPTDAAGAVATQQTYATGLALGLEPDNYLRNNNSYHYFAALDDLIKIGPTLTNVNDLVFLFRQ